VLDDPALRTLLAGLDYQRIDDRLGDHSALASEIWRVFLVVMAAALVIEALLCLPAVGVGRSNFKIGRGNGGRTLEGTRVGQF
jgi:hypothetical protein